MNMIGLVLCAAIAGMDMTNGKFVSGLYHFALALFFQRGACLVLSGPRLTLANGLVVSALLSATILASQSITILVQTGQPTLGLLCVMGISILFPIALSEQLRSI
jgi:hypothetical protein